MTKFCNRCGTTIRRGQYYKWIHANGTANYPPHEAEPIGGDHMPTKFRPKAVDTVEAMQFTDWDSAKAISDWCLSVLYVPPGYGHDLRPPTEMSYLAGAPSFLVFRVGNHRYRIDHGGWVVKDSVGFRHLTEDGFFLKYEPAPQ